MSSLDPYVFDHTNSWMKQVNREWQFRPPVDLRGVADPEVVEAASGHTFTFTLTLGPALTIPAGAHITLEVQTTWEAHLGNCFRRGVRTVGNREQVRACYGAWTDVECSNPQVKFKHAASYGHILDLVDAVVTEGELRPGDEVRFILGPDDGCLLQAQKFAQVAIFPVGVDLEGNGEYRRAAAHPTVKVIGAYPDRLRVFAPGTVQTDAEFPVRILPVDIYSFNPGTGYRGRSLLAASEGLEMPSSVVIDTEVHPTGATVGTRTAEPGVYYVTACDPETGMAGKSNPIGVDFLPDHHIYFGEMHSQMWRSMGTGTTAEFFEWGRDAAGLDFCAPANHYNWRFEVTDEIWQELVGTCNAYNDPGNFATLISYEWGGVAGCGHRNVYFRGDTGEFSFWYKGEHESIEAFWADMGDRDILTVPHHLKAGVNWGFRNDRHQRLAEICSNWCIAESGGRRSVQAALAMGHRIGFVCGTDSHYGMANQGSYHVNDGNGLTCLLAPELTRDAIWQALYDRRCYATTGDRILLNFTLNGHPMGTDVPADLDDAPPRRMAMRTAGTAPIDSVEIVRNNQVVFSAQPRAEVWEGEWTDDDALAEVAFQPTFPGDRPFVFYYLRVAQRNRQQAWSSPIWLTQTE